MPHPQSHLSTLNGLAWVLYALMAMTNYFDGDLARAQDTVSKLGIFLDPIADKMMTGHAAERRRPLNAEQGEQRFWWARQDLNPQPSRYERPALTN